jgi:hypothetical protein
MLSRRCAGVPPAVVHAHQSERSWCVRLYLLLGRSVATVAMPSRSTPVSLFLFATTLLIGIAVVEVVGVPTATVGFLFSPSTCLHCVPSLSLRVEACSLLAWCVVATRRLRSLLPFLVLPPCPLASYFVTFTSPRAIGVWCGRCCLV